MKERGSDRKKGEGKGRGREEKGCVMALCTPLSDDNARHGCTEALQCQCHTEYKPAFYHCFSCHAAC